MLAFFHKNLTTQKTVSGILILLIVFSLGGGMFYPKKANAWWGVVDVSLDPASIAQTVITWVKDAAMWVASNAVAVAKLALDKVQALWEFSQSAAEVALAAFRKKLEDMIVDSIITWIQGGGDPKFVTDWKGFLLETVDQASGDFLEEMLSKRVLDSLCNSNWGLNLEIALSEPPIFAERVKCTFSDIAGNYDEFMNDFSKGGWDNFLTVSTNPVNNPYGLYLTVLDEKTRVGARAKEAAANEGKSGSGFLDDKVCQTISYYDDNLSLNDNDRKTKNGYYDKQQIADFEDGVIISDVRCEKWTAKTPGTIASAALKKSVFKDIDYLQNNERWQSYAAAITDALVNRAITEGVSYMASSDKKASKNRQRPQATNESAALSGNLSTGLDLIKPSTVLALDGWYANISMSEPGLIYYTLDGRDPTERSPVYENKILAVEPSVLKWIAVDYSGNAARVKSKQLNPPFMSGALLSAPRTAAVAADSGSVAFLSTNPQASIYYTLDGTVPNERSSEKYMQKIKVSGPLNLQWFGMDSFGNREQVQALVTSAPFPNGTLSKLLGDALAPPEAKVDFTQSGKTFTLDPSGSKDLTNGKTILDKTDRIVMYEWDFDNDLMYDWKMVDWNKDGDFNDADEQGNCRLGGQECVAPTPPDDPDKPVEPSCGWKDLGDCLTYIPNKLIYIVKKWQYDGDQKYKNDYAGETTRTEKQERKLREIGQKFSSMTAGGVRPGFITVTYDDSTLKKVTLRVTDNEGLTDEKSIFLNMTVAQAGLEAIREINEQLVGETNYRMAKEAAVEIYDTAITKTDELLACNAENTIDNPTVADIKSQLESGKQLFGDALAESDALAAEMEGINTSLENAASFAAIDSLVAKFDNTIKPRLHTIDEANEAARELNAANSLVSEQIDGGGGVEELLEECLYISEQSAEATEEE